MSTTTEIPRCRPFSIIDGMIFVATTAVGFAVVRGLGEEFWSDLRSGGFTIQVLFTILAVLYFSVPMAAGILLVRLIQPRPRLRDVALQPGAIAAGAILITTVLVLTVGAPNPSILILLSPLPLAWGALALSGRWRCEPGWIDRLGVCYGVVWWLGCVILTLPLSF